MAGKLDSRAVEKSHLRYANDGKNAQQSDMTPESIKDMPSSAKKEKDDPDGVDEVVPAGWGTKPPRRRKSRRGAGAVPCADDEPARVPPPSPRSVPGTGRTAGNVGSFIRTRAVLPCMDGGMPGLPESASDKGQHHLMPGEKTLSRAERGGSRGEDAAQTAASPMPR